MSRKSPLDVRPERRALRIYAIDPTLGRAGDLRATLEIPYRELRRSERSFRDDRLEVVDFDGATRKYYSAVDLDDPRIAMQQGLEPSEADPQFHQQMVYAVASRVIENFDRALGRRLRFWGGRQLRLVPHAFQGRNAFYDESLVAVLFGYFLADEDDPGANLPGQPIFTCLSHDIVAHEVAHAGLDRLHPYFREPTSPQVPALHEAFADVVAIFQRFTLVDVVRELVRSSRGEIVGKASPLLDIGSQFGAAAGLGTALRSVIDQPDPSAFARTTEPHALGRILVTAVFDGFIRTYARRTADLIRIATGGSGQLPAGELQPDLVARLASECARVAQATLTMCIRATDYLPPVDPTFSDFLRAMVTADFELNRADESGLRASMIEAFRVRGIRPEAVGSFAVESLLLEPVDGAPDPTLATLVKALVNMGAEEMSRATAPGARDKPPRRRAKIERVMTPKDWIVQQQVDLRALEESEETTEQDEPDDEWRGVAVRLHRWARDHRALVGLEEGLGVRVTGFHPVHRVAPSGELLVEMVAHFVQSRRSAEDLGGLSMRAGVTIVASLDGRLRYRIRKPFSDARLTAMREWARAFDERGGPRWTAGERAPQRIVEAFSARAMDGDRRRWR